ncbi:hypothetical protein HMPREF7215_0056 [Pyramidobacter piscolens W5455]|jgi:hypothetical protein|uniref:Uncharacterized protein n=1 Tax=Pyramidobacter piscolens W5455 TaxID=352165 RepID=A0ABP2HTH6_9BACT|nr:hypothetical protein [Pyramidobacter piscolens]EFB90635.1 hypothetical protein HMPREF7215_0056 [Pyramidobacter piscolens W5455]BDF79098.1 hypothetical protein CE91St28_18920 [Pyramidobacter piscolens]
MIDMSYLTGGKIYWDDWRFEPWQSGSASGVYRRVDFIKAGLLGEVGRYKADDYIIWKYEDGDVEHLFKNVRHQKGLMLQRYIFVRPEGNTTSRSKSFRMGFSGFVEVYQYTPLGDSLKRLTDLTQLIDAAHKYALAHKGESSV